MTLGVGLLAFGSVVLSSTIARRAAGPTSTSNGKCAAVPISVSSNLVSLHYPLACNRLFNAIYEQAERRAPVFPRRETAQ